jgi:hypothetical protein
VPRPGGGRKRGIHQNALGRSRGGFSTKIHARSDHQGRSLGFVLTGGEVSDYRGVDELLALPVAKPKIMLADKWFDGDGVRSALLLKGISPVIPAKSQSRRSTSLRLQGVQGSKSYRAHVQQAEAVQAHHNPIRQNQAVLCWLPSARRSPDLAPRFCQHSLIYAAEARCRSRSPMTAPWRWRQ